MQPRPRNPVDGSSATDCLTGPRGPSTGTRGPIPTGMNFQLAPQSTDGKPAGHSFISLSKRVDQHSASPASLASVDVDRHGMDVSRLGSYSQLAVGLQRS